MAKKLKSRAVCARARDFLGRRRRWKDVEWKCEYPLTRYDIVDIAGLVRGFPRILVEIELHREDPVSNVVKILQWACETKSRDFIVFQAFSKLFKTKKSERRRRAVFVGTFLEKVCGSTYIPLDLKYRPRAGGRYGGGRHVVAADLLGRRVMDQIVRRKLLKHR